MGTRTVHESVILTDPVRLPCVTVPMWEVMSFRCPSASQSRSVLVLKSVKIRRLRRKVCFRVRLQILRPSKFPSTSRPLVPPRSLTRGRLRDIRRVGGRDVVVGPWKSEKVT